MVSDPNNPYSSIPGGGYDAAQYDVSEPGYLGKLARKIRKLGHASTTLPIGRFFYIGTMVNTALVGVAGVMEVVDSVIHGEGKKAFKQLVANTADTGATLAVNYAYDTAGTFGPVASGVFWGNAGWGVVSGNSLPEEARRLTGWALDKMDAGLSGPKIDPYQAEINAKYAEIQQQALGRAPQIQGVQMGQVAFNPAMVPQNDLGYQGTYDITQADPRAMAMLQQLDAAQQVQNPDRAALMGQFRPDDMPHFSQEAARRGQEPEQAYANYTRDGDNVNHVAALERARENEPSVERCNV